MMDYDKAKTIGEMYEAWWKQVGLPTMPSVQREEMRRSFYSGCKAMFVLMDKAAEFEEEEAMKMMQGWDNELKAFIITIQHMRRPNEPRT